MYFSPHVFSELPSNIGILHFGKNKEGYVQIEGLAGANKGNCISNILKIHRIGRRKKEEVWTMVLILDGNSYHVV